MFRKLIYLFSFVLVLSVVGVVSAQDVVIPSPGTMPKIDGNIDEVWFYSTEQAIDTSQVGAAPSSPADGSGTWRALWNWENLYVLVEVNDDALTADSGGGTNKWNDDSVEIYVDGDNSKASSTDENDHQYTFWWGNEVLEEPSALHNGAPSIVGYEYAVVTTDVGYLLEVKMPWMSIMGEAPTPGQEIGFDVWINDDDDGGDRDSQISWYSTDGNGWQDPSVWAVAVLEASEKAANPSPADGAIHADTWATLSWLAAPGAVSHDVYFGDNFDDVEAGIESTFQGNLTETFVVVGFPGFAIPDGFVPGTTYYWRIDEVSADGTIYTGDVWSFLVPPKTAYEPNPVEDGKFVSTDVILSWTAGDDAKLHTVYFGDDFDIVSSATGGAQIGATTYDPGTLEFEKTYYWRVDEFDGFTTYTGDVWSFKTAKAGGGLRADYYEGDFGPFVLTRTDPQIDFNWGDPGSPDPAVSEDNFSVRWTGEVEAGYTETYTFYAKTDDGVRLWVGGKQLADSWETVPIYPIEHSGTINLIAGSTYRIVMEYFESTANAIAELRWESPSTPKQLIPQAALALPIKAGNPNPGSGAVDVKHTPVLMWAAGNSAVSHEVYFGTDEEAVKNATTASPEHKGTKALGDESYDPGQLEWASTYYWRVDEVNSVNADSPWIGSLWSFTTANFLIVDDMESYNDIDEGEAGSNRIFYAWVDGYDNPAVNGSVVGNDPPPFAEQTIVHSGNQSMPFAYDNAVGKSEATLTLTSNRDWTVNGVDTLVIWYIGDAANAPETMYVVLNGTAVVNNDNPDAAQINEWTQWTIDLQAFGINLANVNSITLGLGNRANPVAGGSGIMYFDDIRLYPPAP